MSAQLRYRTLVHNIGRVYSSQPEGRTQLLQTGLDEICTVLAPTTPAQWDLVGTDSERLLRVWVAKESDPAAAEVATQLVDILYELAAASASAAAPLATPLAAATAATAAAVAPALVVADTITHVHPFTRAPTQIYIEEDDKSDTKIISVGVPCDVETEEVEEEAEEESAAEEEAEEEEAEEESAAEEEEEEEDAEESAAEEEVVEPEEAEAEEEDEEEEGMEVEQIFIRGRAYWLDPTTKKLYAVIDEDEVGDEVGVLVNGKAQFLAK
jgi:cobalamin biosynthesis protein CobT